jgi:hypothetical protein
MIDPQAARPLRVKDCYRKLEESLTRQTPSDISGNIERTRQLPESCFGRELPVRTLKFSVRSSAAKAAAIQRRLSPAEYSTPLRRNRNVDVAHSATSRTSPSRQPPLTPPNVCPSSSTRNLAPGLRYEDPSIRITVASAACRPAAASARTRWTISVVSRQCFMTGSRADLTLHPGRGVNRK